MIFVKNLSSKIIPSGSIAKHDAYEERNLLRLSSCCAVLRLLLTIRRKPECFFSPHFVFSSHVVLSSTTAEKKSCIKNNCISECEGSFTN